MDDMLNTQMDIIDFSGINAVIDKTYGQSRTSINLKELVLKAVNGDVELSLGSIFQYIYKTFFNELMQNTIIIRNLIVIALLGAVLKVMTSSFKEKSTSELGFITCYIVLISILFTSLSTQASIAHDLVYTVTNLLEATVPVMLSLIIMSGDAAGAYALNSVVLTGANILSQFIYRFMLPVITFTAVVRMINYLSNKNILKQFTVLVKNISSWVLKGIAIIFMSVLSLVGAAAPIANNAIQKTAKFTVKAIPVVGDVLSGSVDLILTYTHAIKSGTMIALVIAVIIICSVPLIKLIVIIFAYKLTAALIQPVCDERIVECIDTMGDFAFLLLAAGATSIIMFIFSVVVMLGF